AIRQECEVVIQQSLHVRGQLDDVAAVEVYRHDIQPCTRHEVVRVGRESQWREALQQAAKIPLLRLHDFGGIWEECSRYLKAAPGFFLPEAGAGRHVV